MEWPLSDDDEKMILLSMCFTHGATVEVALTAGAGDESVAAVVVEEEVEGSRC